MYPGRVYNSRAGTRVPASQGLRRYQRSKTDNKICWHFCISKIDIFWNYLSLFCLFTMTWCHYQRKHSEKYQKKFCSSYPFTLVLGLPVTWLYILTPIYPGGYRGIFARPINNTGNLCHSRFQWHLSLVARLASSSTPCQIKLRSQPM